MKFSYENNHIWRQFSLALIAAGKHDHALSVLRQCHTMAEADSTILFDAAKLCINHLHMAGEAVEFSKKLIALGDDHLLSSRGYLALGVAYGKQSLEATVKENADSLSEQALEALQKAHSLDTHCTLTLYHLALQHACRGEIKLSLQEVSKALVLEPYHPDCLHLMALLLSAEKQFDKSLMIAKLATEEWPNNFSISFTKAHLEEITLGGEEALLTCQAILELWKQTYQEELEEVKGSGLLERIVSDKKDMSQMEIASLCGKDRSSSPTQSLMALSTMSRGDVVSDAPSGQLSHTQSTSHSAIGQSWVLQTEIWLLIADIYLRMERYDDATACLEEAKMIAPISGQLFFQMGLVSEARGDLSSAKQCYKSALAIMPNHTDSLVQLGVVNYQEGKLTMAEKYLREAIQINPSCHKAW
jgi:tetratricopeptide (TPR) repeat protein